MARPVTIRREAILQVAQRLFLEQGMSVSTAEIAREAGVSEGSIFKRFATKEELFREAMGIAVPDLGLAARGGGGEVPEQLAEVGVALIAFFRELVPRMMRLWAHSGGEASPRATLDAQGTPLPVRLMRGVAEYLAAEQALGRLGPADPEVLARMFVASMHNYVFLALVSGEQAPAAAAQAYARGVVELLWRGVAPDPDRDGGRRKS